MNWGLPTTKQEQRKFLFLMPAQYRVLRERLSDVSAGIKVMRFSELDEDWLFLIVLSYRNTLSGQLALCRRSCFVFIVSLTKTLCR